MISDRAKRVGLKELEIFDYFLIDENLPKHKKEKSDSEDSKVSWGGFDGHVPQVWTNTNEHVINGITAKNFITLLTGKTNIAT